LTRTPLHRLASFLAALALAACGTAAPEPCAPPQGPGAGWEPVSVSGVSLRLPPGYAPDRALPPRPESPGDRYAAWTAGAQGQVAQASRVALVVGRTVPAAELSQVEGGAGPRDVRACTLRAGGRSAAVSTAWFADSTSATGRSYQTIARWDGLEGGRAAALVMVGETPAEQARHLATAATVRIP
jgi:hypothetical protein